MPLTEERRRQLDDIVRQAEANGETEDFIRSLVADFKSKYEGQPVRGGVSAGASSANLGIDKTGSFQTVQPFDPTKGATNFAQDRLAGAAGAAGVNIGRAVQPTAGLGAMAAGQTPTGIVGAGVRAARKAGVPPVKNVVTGKPGPVLTDTNVPMFSQNAAIPTGDPAGAYAAQLERYRKGISPIEGVAMAGQAIQDVARKYIPETIRQSIGKMIELSQDVNPITGPQRQLSKALDEAGIKTPNNPKFWADRLGIDTKGMTQGQIANAVSVKLQEFVESGMDVSNLTLTELPGYKTTKGLVAGTALTPIDIGLDLGVLQHGKSAEDLAGATLNLALNLNIIEPSTLLKGIGSLKTNGAKKTLAEAMGVSFETASKLADNAAKQVEQNPEILKMFDISGKVEPKFKPTEIPDVSGVPTREQISPATAGPATTTKSAVETAKAGEKPVVGIPITEDVTPPKEKINAKEVRSDTGQVYEAGRQREGLQDKGRENLQQPKETGPKAGNAEDEVTGISQERVQMLRDEGVISGTYEKTVKPDSELIAGANKLKGYESAIAEEFHTNSKRILDGEEQLALGTKLDELRTQIKKAAEAKDGPLFDRLDAQAQRIASALDESGTRAGRAFRARQFLFQDGLDPWIVQRRLEQKGVSQNRINDILQDLEKTKKDVEQRDKVIADLEKQLSEEKLRTTYQPQSRARKYDREKIVKEIDDIFKQLKDLDAAGPKRSKKSGAATKITAEDLKKIPEQAALIGKLAKSYARLGAANLEELVIQVQKALKTNLGWDVDRQAIIDAASQTVQRTKSEIEIQTAKLMRELKKESTQVKIDTAAKRKATEELRAARKAEREAIQRAQKAARDVEMAESESIKAKAKIAAEKAKEQAKIAKSVKAEKEKVARREFGEQWKYQERVFRLEEDISKLQDELKAGIYRKESKKEIFLTEELRRLKSQKAELLKSKEAAIRAEENKSAIGLARNIIREGRLFNVEARLLDVLGNTAKLGAFAAQSPVRSLLSETLFRKTFGREKFLFSWPKLKRVFKNAPQRWKDELAATLKGLDPDSLAKFGKSGPFSRFAGTTDIVFKDVYYRLALDDWATDSAKALGGSKDQIAANRMHIFRQLADDVDGPLDIEEVLTARAMAHEFALKNTYNSDNLVGKIAENLKEGPGRYLDNYNKSLGDSWRLFVDSQTMFSKVIGNVVAERASYQYGVPMSAFKYALSRMSKDGISAIAAREIVDLAAKGMTGLALVYYAREYYAKNGNTDVLKGELVTTSGGTKFVKWTLFPKLFGGIDANQLGGALSPWLRGSTESLIQKEVKLGKLTQKQADSIMAKYQVEQYLSQPLLSGTKETAEALSGDKSLEKFAGGAIARSVIPAQVSKIAEYQDPVELRKSKTFWDEFMKRIPKTTLNPNFNRMSLMPNVQGADMTAFILNKPVDDPIVKEMTRVGAGVNLPDWWKDEDRKAVTSLLYSRLKEVSGNPAIRNYTPTEKKKEYESAVNSAIKEYQETKGLRSPGSGRGEMEFKKIEQERLAGIK